MIPGEMQIAAGDIELNKGRRTVTLAVTNTGDRPIQVGSHYHFFETSDTLDFPARPSLRLPPQRRGRHRSAFRAGGIKIIPTPSGLGGEREGNDLIEHLQRHAR